MSIKSKILRELEKKPRTIKELKSKLGNDKKVVRTVDELKKKNKVQSVKGVYSLAASGETRPCTLVKLTARFGFARPDDGGEDIFIPGRDLGGTMPGDGILVEVHPAQGGAKAEGAVRAVTLPREAFVGTVREAEGRLYLEPDDCPSLRILIKKSADGGARPGEKAAIVLLERGDDYDDHRAGVAMRFGDADEAQHCAQAILYSAGIERRFPDKVRADAREMPSSISEKDIRGREDLRALPIFTIDSAHTKDIDDAVYAERAGDGYRLGVHIADASNYVAYGSRHDREAMRRGTSVYYADSVVPMLPRQLSNGICSLNEGEDRFAFSCVMQLDSMGRIVDYNFSKTVICSRVKGVYDEVNAILDGTAGGDVREKYADVADTLEVMRELYEKLHALRGARGAIEIESGEAALDIDASGVCVGVSRRTRGTAERMIEEFMLCANTCAASLARRLQIPFVYRVHEAPDADRIDSLRRALAAAGVPYSFAGESPTPLELAKLLADTRGSAVERFVHTGVLRSMAKAKYDPAPKGHFGLALADYAHFTSPIRRYPDLVIHRILSQVCAGMDSRELASRFTELSAEAAAQSSACEVTAMQVERDIAACYKAEFMRSKLGEEFDGVISSVPSFGVYVELENSVEGLVRAQELSPRELVLVDGICLRDEASGRTWRIGDTLRVKAVGADVAQGHVDFIPA